MDTTTLILIAAAGVVLLLAIILLVARRGRTPAVKDRVEVEPLPVVAAAPPPPAIPDDGDLSPDDLTRLKGLGPKAAAALNEMGIRRYAQLAALDDAAAMQVDAAMGSFRGRLARDRWIEQARLLDAGDVAGFEAQFGKLG